ncbi:MAG: type II toxin-antitoxin system MqsA family antitoxin [Burkholderiales bacterium]
MNCIICKQADTVAGHTTIALERGGATLVFKNVPASVCPNCGEAYVAEGITEELLRTGEEMVSAGTQVDVRSFSASA